MDKLIWIILVVIAGVVLPLQAGFNMNVGKAVSSPLWAVIISFAVGLVALLGYAILTRDTLNVSLIKNIPGSAWIAGIFGAFYVTTVVLAYPRLGPALTFGLIVAGQLLVSLFLDHFNILVQQQHSINIYRILGMVLIITGVVLIRKF
jgi:bacterial/archaeal transporter family-2 protein